MYRKAGFILVLTTVLGALLYFQPWSSTEVRPRFIDRLPNAQIIGQSDLLSLSENLKSTAYFYKIPFREFISPDFVLSQGKGYGLNVQAPVYFFGNEQNDQLHDWGVLIQVRDSLKLGQGIHTLIKLTDIYDTLYFEQRTYVSARAQLALSYGKDWLLICSSNKIKSYINQVTSSKVNNLSNRWKHFLRDSSYSDKAIVAQMESERINELGIESILCALSNDSSSLILHSTITQNDSLSFSLKDNGPSLPAEEYTKHLINLHLDTKRLGKNQTDPLYQLLKNISAKVSFPLPEFLDTWDGDIAFRQGGIQTISEKYITTELDDNFNITEVEKYKRVKISGFSLYLSTNENQQKLLNSLYQKGIITNDGKKVRLLYSPPMYLKKNDTSFLFHTSRYAPTTKIDSTQYFSTMQNYTPINFTIDSTKVKTFYGRVQLPLRKIIRDNIPNHEL
ncbi:MAG: hypothetical protein MK066_04865 [Crocinitomicaceae bacterium]|nr:hypothetical protein [Crocinitomicaceae bacterium]